MAKLVWDKVGTRTYEAGLDRGVLYNSDRIGVPWNGLQAVDESRSGDAPVPLYFDGVKYFESSTPDDFSAILSAITYPDEFLPYDGMALVDRGLYLDNQPSGRFHLSYRTLVGNDVDGNEFGYKIHLLYNLTAQPTNYARHTLGSVVSVDALKWSLTGIPEVVPGYRPTVHAVIDSRKTPSYLMAEIEEILYGRDMEDGSSNTILDGGGVNSVSPVLDAGTPSDSTGGTIDGGPVSNYVSDQLPRIPTLSELVTFISNWELITITDHGDGTWSAVGPEELVRNTSPTSFEIVGGDVTYTDADTFVIKSN
jgi:hypothetical protein